MTASEAVSSLRIKNRGQQYIAAAGAAVIAAAAVAMVMAWTSLFTIAAAGETEDHEAIVNCNTAFAFDLYRELIADTTKPMSNQFFSPYSLFTALTMTCLGADGETAAEMAAVLHLPNQSDAVRDGCRRWIEQINQLDDRAYYTLATANALWGHNDFRFNDTFISDCSQSFQGRFRALDFSGAPEQARQTINDWTAQQTHDRIRDLLPPGAINALTRLVLTNTIYFKGDWQTKFKDRATRDERFTLIDGEEIDVALMHNTSRYGYFENENLQVLDLPYRGRSLSMTIILPRKHDGLSEIEGLLNAANWINWTNRLNRQEVRVYFPKFKMTQQFEAREILNRLGMSAAFDLQTANFSKITDSEQLYLSQVHHKAFIEVDEDGTEAAAATAALMEMSVSLETPSDPPPVFRADHPFVFIIRETGTNSILFMGSLLDPRNDDQD